jgi:hypothetical protein
VPLIVLPRLPVQAGGARNGLLILVLAKNPILSEKKKANRFIQTVGFFLRSLAADSRFILKEAR